MDLRQKKVLVVGGGISGIAAVRLLKKAGAEPVLYDGNAALDRAAVAVKLAEAKDTPVFAGELPQQELYETQLAVLSPGVPADTAFAETLRGRGIPVWGEVELGYACSKGRVIAITGTNGKTTTTALTGKMMRDYYDSVYVVGNIGNPYTADALDTVEESVTVAEISSFQLETIDRFKPDVSAILNITPDHLNRHHTMEQYVAIKESITKNQTGEDVCVLNYRDDYTRAFGERCPARVVYFYAGGRLEDGYYLENDGIYYARKGNAVKLLSMEETKLLGEHNAENVMAAIAMASAAGVPMESVLQSARDFSAVEHRIEYVATKGGIDYYNDSKGTNPDAAVQGIRAMKKPTVLLGGGFDKGSEYDTWIEAFDGKVKCLVLVGQTRDKIAACAREHGFLEIALADSFAEAMQLCAQRAERGDAVLLSPACASWDMFPNYETRGRIFKEFVHELEE